MPPTNRSDQPTNRLEVDVSVMQDQAMEHLRQAAEKFDRAASVIDQSVGTLGESVKAAAGISGKSLGPDSSSVAPTNSSPSQGQAQRVDQLRARGGVLLNSTSSAPMVPPSNNVAPGGGGPGGHDDLQAAELAAGGFLASELFPEMGEHFGGRVMRRAAGYFALKKATSALQRYSERDMQRDQFGNVATDADGDPLMRGASQDANGNWNGQKWREGASAGALLARNKGVPMAGALTKGSLALGVGLTAADAIRGWTMALPQTQFGVGAGYDSHGWLGTHFMSPAFTHYYGTQMQAYKDVSGHPGAVSRALGHIPGVGGVLGGLTDIGTGYVKNLFGFGGLNTQQAKAIESALQEYGWGQKGQGDRTDMIRGELVNYTKRYAGMVSPEQMMELGLDQSMRHGIGRFSDFKTTMDNLGLAAQAANMNVKNFAESLGQATDAFAGGTGIDKKRASAILQAASQATGLSPTKVEPILSNRRNQLLGMALTGARPYDILKNQGKGAGAAILGSRLLLGSLGRPDWWQHNKNNPQLVAQAKDQLTLRYWMDPEIFSGLTVDEFINQMMRGNVVNQMRANVNMANQFTQSGIESQLRMGMGERGVREFDDRLSHDNSKQLFELRLAQHAFAKDPSASNRAKLHKAEARHIQWERTQAREVLGKAAKRQGQAAAQQTNVVINLSPEAHRLIRVLQEPRKSQANSQARHDRSAYGQKPFWDRAGDIASD